MSIQPFDNSRIAMNLVFLCLITWPLHTISGQEVDFAKQIRPILNQHCLACHGLDKEHREADLRLDNFEDATDFAIVPGDPDGSELFNRISSTDASEVMPPPEHGSLTAGEIELIRSWIASGAEYTQHWAFVKPQMPQVPASGFKSWAHNEIDHFIANQLEARHLSPSQHSDWHRLIRRAALDLTGLPPSEEQVRRIVEQPTLKTYEALVDEWLASPAFGEHWAAMWLDLARYADSIGYTEDHERTIWPWRDWVIRSFNENKPFDQFTVEQLAGDLLPDATEDQRLATAFHRNTVSNSEGGTIDEEFRVIAVKDRVNTTVNVWMGITMRCAECHTHKYDPISIQEYYQFYAFFNQTADADRSDEEPRLELITQEQRNRLASLIAEIDEVKRKNSQSANVTLLAPLSVLASSKTSWKIHEDQSIGLVGEIPDNEDLSITFTLLPGTHHGLKLEAMPEPKTGNRVGLSDSGNFILSLVKAELGSKSGAADKDSPKPKPIAFSDAAADFSQMDYDIHYVIRAEADEFGWAVFGAPDGFASNRTAVLTFAEPIVVDSPTELTVSLLFRSKAWPKHIISRLRMSSINSEQPAEKFRNKELDPYAAQLSELERQQNELANPIRVPIISELPVDERRTTQLMIRGSYLNPGETVAAAVPASFHAFPAEAPNDRLGVARWLLDAENPLTARVTVNRFWARIFGRGIVETEEDFGTQGSMPTHPDLLDWLATDFQRNGWNVKRLLKQLVMSSTYRQANQTTPDQLRVDPQNLYFSRGPRGRLSAEVVRDQALLVSGLLSQKMYGAPVYPPSPVKKIRNSFAGDFIWHTSTGEDRYRRAIYTFLKRSQPHPLFETFDMSTRQVCSFRRLNTNTPLQSFMTLNDEAFLECAQQLAHRMSKHSTVLDEQLREGLETALRQPADPSQIGTLKKLVARVSQEYALDVSAARTITGIDDQEILEHVTEEKTVELASLTVAANVILNLDSFLTK
jgi:mono/diheme cytochrome c family protein